MNKLKVFFVRTEMSAQYKSTVYKKVGRDNVLIIFFNIFRFTEKPNDIYLLHIQDYIIKRIQVLFIDVKSKVKNNVDIFSKI